MNIILSQNSQKNQRFYSWASNFRPFNTSICLSLISGRWSILNRCYILSLILLLYQKTSFLKANIYKEEVLDHLQIDYVVYIQNNDLHIFQLKVYCSLSHSVVLIYHGILYFELKPTIYDSQLSLSSVLWYFMI